MSHSYKNIGLSNNLEYKHIFYIIPYWQIKYEKSQKDSYLFSFALYVFKLLFLFEIIIISYLVNHKFNVIDFNLDFIRYCVLTFIYILFFSINDFMVLIGIQLNKDKNSIELDKYEKQLARTVEYKSHHRIIVFYETIYNDYSNEDLIREDIYLQYKAEKKRNPNLIEKYIVPLSMVLIGTIYGFINSLYIVQINSLTTSDSNIITSYLITLMLYTSIPFTLYVTYYIIKGPNYINDLALKVVKLMLSRRNIRQQLEIYDVHKS